MKIGISVRTGSVWPKISGTRGRPLPTILCQKTGISFLSYGNGIRMWAQVSFVYSHNAHV